MARENHQWLWRVIQSTRKPSTAVRNYCELPNTNESLIQWTLSMCAAVTERPTRDRPSHGQLQAVQAWITIIDDSAVLSCNYHCIYLKSTLYKRDTVLVYITNTLNRIQHSICTADH
uniref:Secreted protein n=1 Tax=Mesocestoides corti TaxID=53468 RepID=A0A5K3FUN0_MESCO